MERDDEVQRPGSGPVAFGALPFLPGAPGEVVVPEVVVARAADGARWMTTIVGHAAEARDALDGRALEAEVEHQEAPRTSAARFTIEPGIEPAAFQAGVAAGRDLVRAGRLTKVVLARDIVVTSDRPLDVHAILLRLRATFGTSYRYAVDGFIGASPELLVARQDDVVRSHPLAGTAPRTGDPAADARLAAQLIASTKDQVEHRVVVEVVHDSLLPWCSYLDWEAEPSVVTVANVQHLGTQVEGRLSRPLPNVLDLVAALQPTPALGGHPKADALALIAELEGLDRGRYGGPVGWVDAEGNGQWAVGIRGAEVDGASAHLFAGVGVVADSDPDAELAETQAKFQAMLSAIVRP
jgi:menaquinone-specific isochorismate synthase